MPRRYDVEDKADVTQLNRVLNIYGIHFEKDMFDNTYVLLDPIAYCPDKNRLRRKKKGIQE